ncbi:hypothetical protein BH20ACT19_BH20ACT19_01240 [soil metagenome]
MMRLNALLNAAYTNPAMGMNGHGARGGSSPG